MRVCDLACGRRRPRSIWRATAVVFAMLMAQGCTTLALDDGSAAVAARIDEIWRADNEVIRAQLGERDIAATSSQVDQAARRAFEVLGLSVLEANSGPTRVWAGETYSAGGWSWRPAIRSAEERRVREVFASSINPRLAQQHLAPADETILGVADLAANGRGGIRLRVSFRSEISEGTCRGPCARELPPAALRSAYFAYWKAFDEELARLKAQTRPAAAPRKPAAAAPSRKPKGPKADWVLPPSGWKPPPR